MTGQKIFDNPILKRVKRDRNQSARSFEHPLRSGEAKGEFGKLIVDEDAQCLDGSRDRAPASRS
jgi:hypothetical protein